MTPWASDLRKKICHIKVAIADTLVGCFVGSVAPIDRGERPK